MGEESGDTTATAGEAEKGEPAVKEDAKMEETDAPPAPAGAPKPLGPPGGEPAATPAAAPAASNAAEAAAAAAPTPPAAAAAAAPAAEVLASKADAEEAEAKAKEAAAAAAKAEAARAVEAAQAAWPFRLLADSCVMQGRRPKQEDRHVKVPDLTKAAKALKMPIDHLEQPCAFFAVYDGHQGHLCAEFVAKNFHLRLLKRLSAEQNPEAWTDERFCATFRDVCEELDAEFLAKFRTAPDGCTVCVVLLTGTRCTVAWVGDSGCLLARRTSTGHLAAVSLTEDHRPSDKSEADRIKKAGGLIVDLGYTKRVAHQGYEERIRELRRAQAQGLGCIGKEPIALAVSRALGDREFKAVTGKALLIPTPSVRCVRLEPSHLFLSLMCDGIFDVMKPEDVVEELGEIRELADPAADVRSACGALVQEAYKRGSADNLTTIMVRLNWKGASPAVHVTKRRAKEELVDASAAAVSKRRRLEANKAVSAQKVAQYERMVGTTDDGKATKAPPSPPRAPASKEVPMEVDTPAAGAAATTPAAAPADAPAGEEVILHGLPPERGLNGSKGVAVKTISDGRRVVRLADGRELAFKAENLRPAGAGAAADPKAQPEAKKAPSGDEVVLVGLPPARGLNGTRGVALQTISDGRRVVRLSDGRELAFKAENLQPAGSAGGNGASASAKPAAAAASAAAPASKADSGGEVEIFGHAKADLNGARGTLGHTISDGRRVVKLTDGRELAFKPENIRPASGKAQAPAGAAAKPPAAAAAAASAAPAPKQEAAGKAKAKPKAKSAPASFTFV
eukprot:TRINITY_DN662_c4_g1_i1.p1 TRINITY_DN662_c4_g1~~TRINITY_DN662_c4_g1_i1.p1  ORF type:complete len:793 (+),score=236.15 TRINITY_DN662_c4_g1_i1:93-2471(+)